METDSLEIVDAPAGRGHRAPAFHAVPAVRVNLARVLLAGKDDWEKPCFVGPAGEIRYDQFVTAVRRLASALQGQGVREGQRLVLALDDGIEQAAIFYASLAVGAVPLVLNPRLDAGALADILADCQAAWIFTQTEQLGDIQRAQHSLTFSVRIARADPGALAAQALDWVPASADPGWDAFPERGPDDLAFMQYTSGSTGAPKGAMHTARSALSACASFAAARLGLHAQDRIYSVPKAFFGYGMGNTLLFPLYVGAQAVLDARWPTPAVVRENLRRFAPSVLFAVPTLYRRLLEETDFARADSSLRLAFSAGAPLPAAIQEAWRARVGLELYDGIGATELCHVFATTYPDTVRSGSLGRMLPGYRHRIVDEQGSEVVPGEVGVLMVEAPCTAIGYWNNPAATREKFRHGWYRTGDLFSEDAEGWLYFHGREDDRFKVFGRWVDPLVMEEWVKARFPQVQEAFVVPASPSGGEVRPVLLLKPARGDAGALAERVRAAMGEAFEHHQRPVCCLPLDTVLFNANGKVDRRALTRRAQAALADGSEGAARRGEGA